MEQKNLGTTLSPILQEIEHALWDNHSERMLPLAFTEDGVKASIKIFMDVMMSEMWKLQESEGIDMDLRGDMAHTFGTELRNLIKVFTNIDTHELYKK